MSKSMEDNLPDFDIYCFCMDDEAFSYLQTLTKKHIIPISYKTLDEYYPDLSAAKSNRSRVEYYFTCTSATCSYVLAHNSYLDMVTYLDADLCFFSSLEPIFDELSNASVGITDHKFYGIGNLYKKYGKFNVGWVTFINNPEGRKILEDYRKDCINWCYDHLEDGKFGDQKYLDYWEKKYSGVHIIQHIGANVGPWNIGKYSLDLDENGAILLNRQRLIFYHFASLKQLGDFTYTSNVSRYLTRMSKILNQHLYLPYVQQIKVYNNQLGVKRAEKCRNEIAGTGLFSKVKKATHKLRQFFYNDFIEIKQKGI